MKLRLMIGRCDGWMGSRYMGVGGASPASPTELSRTYLQQGGLFGAIHEQAHLQLTNILWLNLRGQRSSSRRDLQFHQASIAIS